MRRAHKIIQLLCGLAILYVTLGSAVGFALDRPEPNIPDCWPFSTEAGIMESTCSTPAAEWFWSVVVGWPRFVIVLPATALLLLKEIAANMFHHMFKPGLGPSLLVMYWRDTLWFAGYSIPLALAAWASFAYWKTASKPFAIGLTAILLCEILYLGWAG